MDHLHSVSIFAALAHPCDGIQRIVEEMRVDLCLQRLQLGLAQDDLLLAHGGHQPLDTSDHVAEGIRKILHLPRAAHRAKDKVVCVLLKRLHCVLQLLERAGQQTGQHPAHHQRRHKDQRCRCHGDAHHLPEAFVDGLINVADADNAPWAVRHALDTVDDGILHIGAVTKAGQTPCFLLFQACVEKLLLRVVDHIAALIHQVAVAVLADADVVDRCGQLLEAQIYRKPTAAAAVPRHSTDDRDDPRVVAVKDRLYMRRADVAMPQAPGRGQVKGEVAQYVGFRRAARLGPAVQ